MDGMVAGHAATLCVVRAGLSFASMMPEFLDLQRARKQRKHP